MSTRDPEPPGGDDRGEPAEWSFPTRTCRICFEAVVPTVTMYPPGLPISFQHPVVEYKSDEGYGRLLKPCLCRGSQRYIHEHCLRQQRTLGQRANSLWKCPTCGYQFNFQRLKTQRLLQSRGSTVFFTLCFLILIIFVLGFIADPIINFYIDPYDTLTGNTYWYPIDLADVDDEAMAGWGAHFAKGFVSLGVFGIIKTLALNPIHWWNWRSAGMLGGRSRPSLTGRNRVMAISWFAIIVGICSAFFLFYKWVQSIISMSLQYLGNHIVDTQLPGDDDDIKPPPGWKPNANVQEETTQNGNTQNNDPTAADTTHAAASSMPGAFEESKPGSSSSPPSQDPNLFQASNKHQHRDEGISALHRQPWSFTSL